MNRILPDDDRYSPYAPMQNINNINFWVTMDLSPRIDSGGFISTVTDVVNGFDFSQVNPSFRGVETTNLGLNVLRLASGEHMNGVTGMLPLGNGSYTYLLVALNRADAGGANYVDTNSVTTNQSLAIRRVTVGGSNLNTAWWSNNLYAGTVNDTEFYVIISTYDGTIRSHYIDGIFVGSDTPGVHNMQSSTYPILATTSTQADVDLADVMLISRNINALEVQYLSYFFLNKIGK